MFFTKIVLGALLAAPAALATPSPVNSAAPPETTTVNCNPGTYFCSGNNVYVCDGGHVGRLAAKCYNNRCENDSSGVPHCY